MATGGQADYMENQQEWARSAVERWLNDHPLQELAFPLQQRGGAVISRFARGQQHEKGNDSGLTTPVLADCAFQPLDLAIQLWPGIVDLTSQVMA